MLVWYVAYGSNLLRSRLMTYLAGGSAPGSVRSQPGARDATEPRESRPFHLDRPLVFAHRSRTWGGGGICFLDPDRSIDRVTAGRAWLVTEQQLSDVWAQENGMAAGVDLDFGEVPAGGSLDVGSGGYGRLLSLGSLEGYPALTFTCATLPELNPANPPYLRVVGRGLMEAWGWSSEQAAAYLARCPGNAGRLEPAAVRSVLDGGTEGGTET